MDPNLCYEIESAIVKHFDAYKGGLDLFIEGQTKRRTTNNFLEVRISGPTITKKVNDTYDVEYIINTLIQVEKTNNFYNLAVQKDIVKQGFTNLIETDLGCLQLISKVISVNFGEVAPNLMQTFIEGIYKMEL